MEKIVPDGTKSLADGAIQPWTTPKFREWYQDLARAASAAKLRVDVPFNKLSPGELDVVMNGHGQYDGIKGFFAFLEKKSYKIYYRVLLARYRGYTICPSCQGARLRPEVLAVKVISFLGLSSSAYQGFASNLASLAHVFAVTLQALAIGLTFYIVTRLI